MGRLRPMPSQPLREQAIEPGLEHVVGDLLVAPQAQRQIAGLRTAETSARPVDQSIG